MTAKARSALLLPLSALLAFAPSAGARTPPAPPPPVDLLASFEGRVTEHVLPNGWTFLLVERPVAPVFSFATIVDVGGAQEVPGITGIAHMFEHMAFKGTPNVGTRDAEGEAAAIEAIEAAYQAFDQARRAIQPDEAEVARLRADFEAKQEAAAAFVVPNEFGEVVEREGGVGLNAGTSADGTIYNYSLPSNKLELFAFLESERFLHPTLREFYKERDVVQEERRLRTDSQPIGRLIEQALATAFVAHPYGQPTVGHMSDLDSISITDARAFFETHYVPANMVTVLVGDVRPSEAIPILDKYFGRIPAGPEPPPLRTVEPPGIAEKTVTVVDPSQPTYLELYHRPAVTDADDAVYDAIDDILSNGRTSRLYRKLVRDLKIAAFAGSFSGFPGVKYPNLWIAIAVPARDHSNAECQAAIREELQRLVDEPVSDGELRRFRTRARDGLLRSLASNAGLAEELATAQTIFGDWRAAFRSLEHIDAVTAADVQRVAAAMFVAKNRTVAEIVTAAAATSDAPTGP